MNIDLHNEFQNYLRMVGLDKVILNELQMIELKRAFMGGCGQLLVIFRDVMSQAKTEEEFQKEVEGLTEQILQFWKSENEKYSSKNN